MNCTHEDLESGVRILRLSGRMDIEGSAEISLRFTIAATTGGNSVVVDLSGVEFLASVGVGTLVSAAKSIHVRKGRIVLCGAGAEVQRTLDRTNIPTIIPCFGTLAEATAALAGASAG